MGRLLLGVLVLLGLSARTCADAPVASYLFPAGGQRGTVVPIRVGGLNLHDRCGFEVLGPGLQASTELRPMRTIWFEGPLLPLPESQQAEDYPRDMSGQLTLAKDAPLGMRRWRLWTSQGATPSLGLIIGDLPEIVEEEIDGDPVPVSVPIPITINGRIFPREDVDIWTFKARKGESYSCAVAAASFASPLEARLEVFGPSGRRLVESMNASGDPRVAFQAVEEGTHQIRISDVGFRGGQNYVYRLTLTSGPMGERVFPLGGRKESSLSVNAGVQPLQLQLPARSGLWTPPSFPGVVLDVDELEEHEESGILSVKTPPCILNGRLERPGKTAEWSLSLRKDIEIVVELKTLRLGSPLRGIVTWIDPQGKDVARSDRDTAEPTLRFRPARDGIYRLRLEERFRQRGGTAFAYRLRVAPAPDPDFRLRLDTDALTLSREGKVSLRVHADRVSGFSQPIAIEVLGLPPGVTAGPTLLAPNQTTAEIPFKADAKAPLGPHHLKVRGTAGPHTRQAMRSTPGAEVETVLLGIALPTPFKVVGVYDMRWAARGTVHRRKYRIERNGFEGPLEIRLADRQARHLQGVRGPTIVLPSGVSEFEYPVSLPPWMETGRTSRTCVMALGTILDASGHPHTVSFTSVNPNEQVVAVVEPGRLGVELGRSSVAVFPGEMVTIDVTVRRAQGLSGPVTLELLVPDHMRALSAAPVTIPATAHQGTLTLRCVPPGPVAYNMPVVVRATLLSQGTPLCGEARLAVVAPSP